MTGSEQVDVRRAELDAGGSTIDGWVAEIGTTTATGHGREEALRNLAVNLWREAL